MTETQAPKDTALLPVREEMNTPQREAFWTWLPRAYRDGDVGQDAKFTKWNMEVAHLAGWLAARSAIEPNPSSSAQEVRAALEWRTMESAPKDGKHCILAVRHDCFIYSVQGTFDGRKWRHVLNTDEQPLAWMPNVLLPDELLPEGFGRARKALASAPSVRTNAERDNG